MNDPANRRDRLSAAIGAPFQFQTVLGTGGQAEVWLARDVDLDRAVAIKVLRPDVVAEPGVVERLRREALTIARIDSPYVVPILQFVSREETCFLVMPFVAGETLAAAIARRGQFSVEEGAKILRDVSLGLATAHDLGVVHRDVKPSNILIDGKTGGARLTDFGIAKALHTADLPLTAAGSLVGSAPYMSPEQFDGTGDVATATDIYALGVVAFEALTGKRPFDGQTAARLAVQHASQPPKSLLDHRVPPTIADVVDRCLAKDPADRPRAHEVAAVFDRLNPSSENEDAESSRKTRATGPRRIGKLAVLLLAALVLSVFEFVLKGEALVALRYLLKVLLRSAQHLIG